MTSIAVLGDGITAKAVHSHIEKYPETYVVVAPEDADIIVTSPGIPPHKWPEVTCEIISDIEFAYRILKERDILPTIIGITGTNGKTTVTAGIAHCLNVTPYGNIGHPLILDVDTITNESTIVIELSSYQLTSSPTLFCNIAVITNIENDHQDWHQTFDHYKQAKLSLLKSDQVCFVPDSIIQSDSLPAGCNVCSIESLSIPKFNQFYGQHNQVNAATIQAVLLHCGLDELAIKDQIETFKLPPFRCEPIYSQNNRTIINDSKATNMAATLAAVNSFDGAILLILSGQPKEPYTDSFMSVILSKCHQVYAAGDLARNPNVFPQELQSKIVFFNSLEEATKSAIDNFKSGIILFSPSAASFDEFKNYNHRGEAFSNYVNDSI